MNEDVLTLSSIFSPWEAISDKYEGLFSALKDSIQDPGQLFQKEESLFWEQFAFELIITMLLAKHIPFEATANDVQPIVKDLDGMEKEIDFRIRILGREVYFGATHFYGRPKDLGKDTEDVDIEIRNIERNGIPHSETGKIVKRRSHIEYLNRRMAVRVAREGKHKLNNDYIYIFFPKLDPGFGGGLDGISKGFTFSSKANYEYRPFGITGIIVIGQYVERTHKYARLQKDILLVRTLAFDSCSELMKQILTNFDMNTIDMRIRNRQVEALLKNGNE